MGMLHTDTLYLVDISAVDTIPRKPLRTLQTLIEGRNVWCVDAGHSRTTWASRLTWACMKRECKIRYKNPCLNVHGKGAKDSLQWLVAN